MTIKVLIIDDDPAMAELTSLILQTHGLETVVAIDGGLGVEMVKNENPDIIILDLMMPGKDGWQVCKEVRAFSKVPIAVLSAIDDPSMIASALDAGADDYMIKPIPSAELIAHVNNLTRRANAEKNGGKNMLYGSNSSPSYKASAAGIAQKPLQA